MLTKNAYFVLWIDSGTPTEGTCTKRQIRVQDFDESQDVVMHKCQAGVMLSNTLKNDSCRSERDWLVGGAMHGFFFNGRF